MCSLFYIRLCAIENAKPKDQQVKWLRRGSERAAVGAGATALLVHDGPAGGDSALRVQRADHSAERGGVGLA